MHYQPKTESPAFFEDCRQQLPPDAEWHHFSDNRELSSCKQQLHEHLIAEQSGLCIYCERQINRAASHVEHVYPQSVFTDLVFDFQNLVASCNGESCVYDESSDFPVRDSRSCGHRKSDDMNPVLFLNPVTEPELERYFVYDKQSCAIKPGTLEPARASYTLNLLHLDNPRLNNERNNARIALNRVLSTYPPQARKASLNRLLAHERPFISFLRFNYSALLSS
ncbi:MAG: TIGR02646 family protein [Thiothrix sp.]|nr:TIGR02646 family protein [Thiothrix sp.]HPE61051.1 TIGR02646 family protein [Thiolinea sp.]